MPIVNILHPEQGGCRMLIRCFCDNTTAVGHREASQTTGTSPDPLSACEGLACETRDKRLPQCGRREDSHSQSSDLIVNAASYLL